MIELCRQEAVGTVYHLAALLSATGEQIQICVVKSMLVGQNQSWRQHGSVRCVCSHPHRLRCLVLMHQNMRLRQPISTQQLCTARPKLSANRLLKSIFRSMESTLAVFDILALSRTRRQQVVARPIMRWRFSMLQSTRGTTTVLFDRILDYRCCTWTMQFEQR